jgi:hypothetical protein
VKWFIHISILEEKWKSHKEILIVLFFVSKEGEISVDRSVLKETEE